MVRKAGAIGGYLKDIATLGSHGENPKNMSTELMDLIRKVLGRAIIPIYVALVPMFVAKAESGKPEPELISAGLLLPHVWFWFLHKYYPVEFFTRFVGCAKGSAVGKLKKFWASFHPDDPRRLPCFDEPGFNASAIPIGVHGDAVPCTKKDSLDVLSFFGMMGVGSTAQICFLHVCTIPEMPCRLRRNGRVYQLGRWFNQRRSMVCAYLVLPGPGDWLTPNEGSLRRTIHDGAVAQSGRHKLNRWI